MLANSKLPPEMRKLYEGKKSLLPDYARFDIQIDQTLVGSVPSKISVTWDNSTLGEPEQMVTGPFLIALRSSKSRMPPLRGPSAFILSSPEPAFLTVLQAPCSSPFIFESASEEARGVRFLLAAKPR